MTPRPRDTLLTAARIVISISLVLVSIAFVGTLIAAPAMLVFQQPFLAHFSRDAGHALGSGVVQGFAALALLGAIMLALSFRFLQHLRRMIDSVAHDDAFAPINAQRLERMGWLTVAIQIIAIPAGGLAHWLAIEIRQSRIEFGASLGGILMALVLFILARVFREGARMRDDLEGTV